MSAKPSENLVGLWMQALSACEPFARMDPGHVRRLVLSAHERYWPPGGQILGPQAGAPQHLYWIRQGCVNGQPDPELGPAQAFQMEAGSVWPVSALLGGRPVSSRYTAHDDCFMLCFPWDTVKSVMNDSPVLAGHLQQQARSVLQAAWRQIRQTLQSRWLQTDNLDQALVTLPAREVLCMPQSTPLRQALSEMQRRRVGSVLLKDGAGQLCGILTRHDVLDRVVLAEVPLDAPASSVMSGPVRGIEADLPMSEAALLMAKHDIRHLPVLRQGEVINLVSERDLFAAQRLTLRHVGALVQSASNLSDFQLAAGAIRNYAGRLLAQGTSPQLLTRLVSDLNDRLTRKLLVGQLLRSGLSEQDMCWIALGSEGRQEQTIATDQDNALIFRGSEQDRPRWQAFALEVNRALDACGYPLCKGGIMASSAIWCRTLDEWRSQCAQWIEQGRPADLLEAAVFFDLRGLHGQLQWADQLHSEILQRIAVNPRFLRQSVQNHLGTGVALNWHGGLAWQNNEGHEFIDVKLSGTAIAVEAARILALSQGVVATSTEQRLLQAGRTMGVPDAEVKGWVTAFYYLQALRLKQQLLHVDSHHDANQVPFSQMDLVDRQMLKVAFRAIRSLQQRLQLDYLR